jgi:signal transduction histidine kinase
VTTRTLLSLAGEQVLPFRVANGYPTGPTSLNEARTFWTECHNARATKQLGPNQLGVLARFGLLALVPVIALGALLARQLNIDVQERYLDSSRTSATLIATVGVQPLVTSPELRSGFTDAEITAIDQRLQGAALSKEVRRLKIWNRQGTVLYSDNHALIGRTFEIEDDLAEALDGESEAGITDGHAPENQGDDLEGPLVEVYVPLTFEGDTEPSGAFELYLPYAPVQAAIDNELRNLYLLLGLGLTLFYASMFPVVVIADRWRRRLVREAENTALANLAVLERLNKLKSEFLMRISHQFRTALVGIEGFSELIRDSEDLDLDKVKAFAGDIYTDAERLDQAFSDMLELDGMETGASVLKLSRVDVNDVIAAVVAATRKDFPRALVAFTPDAHEAVLAADKEKVAQVLNILVGNAIKYSPSGSSVTITTREAHDELVVSVADHGPGMPADFDNGLFVGYTRHDARGGNGAHPGTGLGLPIARQIVEMHGGRIWFDSSTGAGTTFHFALPLKVRPSREMRAVSRV